jgi:hypothetical protein
MSGARAVERVRIDAVVKIAGEGATPTDEKELVLRTRDLSEQGLFLYTAVAQAYPIRVGSTLELELLVDPPVTCKVVVVRVVEPGSAEAESFPTGFGVRIVELEPDARANMRALIRARSEPG